MTLLIVAAGILTLLVILLCIPLEIELSGHMQGKPDVRVRFIYLFRLISWDLKRWKDKSDSGRPVPEKPKQNVLGLTEAWELSQVDGLIEVVWSLIKKLFHNVKAGRVEADLRISLGDDYYTGMLFGYLIPFMLYVEQPPQYDVKIQPAFEEDLLLEGNVYGNWQVRPIEVLEPCLAFAFSRPAWRAGRKFISYRCSKKD